MERACVGGTVAPVLLRMLVLDHVSPPEQPDAVVSLLAPQAAASELSSAVCFTLAELAHADDSTHNSKGKAADALDDDLALGGGAAVLSSVSAGAPLEAVELAQSEVPGQGSVTVEVQPHFASTSAAIRVQRQEKKSKWLDEGW